eukprot:COSAG05_NODE_12744_length_456_cov_1.016807_1_plen_93_part_00
MQSVIALLAYRFLDQILLGLLVKYLVELRASGLKVGEHFQTIVARAVPCALGRVLNLPNDVISKDFGATLAILWPRIAEISPPSTQFIAFAV